MPTHRHVVVVVIALLVMTTIAAAAPRGSPQLSLHVPENRVTAGEETDLEIFVLNAANVDLGGQSDEVNRVTTARDVRLTLRGKGAPVEVLTATRPVGNVPEGVTGPVTFSISVSDDAEPGEYELPIDLGYRWTRQISGDPPAYGNEVRTETRRVTIEVEDDARFEVVSASADGFPDGAGTITLGLRNVGTEAARNARVELASEASKLTFDGASAAKTFVGRWEPGETRTVVFEGQLADGADRRPLSLSSTVTYQNDRGETRSSETLSLGVAPGPRTSRFTVVETASDLAVGDTGTVTVEVRNDGDEAVRDARLSVTSGDPKLTFAGEAVAETYVGALDPGEAAVVAVEARIAEGADIRPYPLSATMTFREADGETRTSDALVTSVTPDALTSEFPVVNATADVAAGESGSITLEVRNDGDETVRDARLSVTSDDSKLTFGGQQTASTFVGTWEPGEVKTFGFSAVVSDAAGLRPLPVSTTVTYREPDGETRSSEPSVAGVVPRVKRFALRNVQSTLAVGEEGRIEGELENTGVAAARDVVVVFDSENPNVEPIETEVAVGDLAPGERAPFSFDVEISDAAGAGQRQFPFSVRYKGATDEVQVSSRLDVRVDVGPKRNAFEIEPTESTVSAGASGTLTLRVTNAGDERLTDISAKLFTNDPLSSDDDEAFVDALDPGESTTITFAIAAGGGALEKVYPVSLDFQYDDADGDTLLSDTYRVPVQVTRRSGGGAGLLLGALVLLVLVGGSGYYLYRQGRLDLPI